MTASLFARVGSIEVLLAASALWLLYAVRVVRRADQRRADDALTFDLARAQGITALLWCAVSLALLIDPELGATPTPHPGVYSIATATVLLFVDLAVGGVTFLVFRWRHLRGEHEWQARTGRA